MLIGIDDMSGSPLRLSIVVPTFNVAEHQGLLHRLEATLGMTGWGISLSMMTPLMGRQLLCATLLGPTIEFVACKELAGEDCLPHVLRHAGRFGAHYCGDGCRLAA